jgi:hypothetical protein
VLPVGHPYLEAQKISKLDDAFTAQQLIPFSGVKTWAK